MKIIKRLRRFLHTTTSFTPQSKLISKIKEIPERNDLISDG
jgi:hypothetical protein